MNYLEIPEGTYVAKPIRARAGRSTNKGTPYIEIEFQIDAVDSSLRWTGYMTEKTSERTSDTMALLDWNGDITFGSDSLNLNTEVSVVVERQLGTDGKERPRIAWVNELNARKFEGVDPAEAKSIFAGFDVKGLMAEARARRGKTLPKPKVKNHAPGAAQDDEDTLPF